MTHDDSYWDRLCELAGINVSADRGELVPTESTSFRARTQVSALTLLRTSRKFSPFPYQSNLIEFLVQDRELASVLVLPTGAGKTTVAMAAALRWLEKQQSGSVVWIAPQRELLNQAFGTAERLWLGGSGPPALDLSLLPEDKTPTIATRPRITFATPQLILARGLESIQAPHLLHVGAIVDEVHHFGAEAFNSIAQQLRAAGGRLLGMSATPQPHHGDSRSALQRVFAGGLLLSEELGATPIRALQAKQVLARVSHVDIEVPPHVRAGVFGAASRWRLRDLVTDAERWNAVLETLESGTKEDRTLVSCIDRRHGIALLAALQARGKVTAAYIDGTTPMSARMSVFEELILGRVQVLLQVQLVSEGVDLPCLNRLVLTYPISSEIDAVQLIGRILRGPGLGGAAAASVHSSDIDEEWLNQSLYLADHNSSTWATTRV